MATVDDTKIPLTSADVNAERVARLRELFPEAFTEGKLDLEKLSALLGDGVTDAAERYGLSWTGKSEAIKNIQTQTTGTLAICLERKITQETLRGIMARKPQGVICLDVAFAGNDQLKTNVVLEMKSHGIEFHTA
jgi:hypothetical protein